MGTNKNRKTPFDIGLLPVLNGNPDNNGAIRRSGMIALVNFTGIHAAGATDALAHIDDRPFTAIHSLYHGNRMGRANADAAAAAFTFFSVKIIRHNRPDIINCFIHIVSASSGVSYYVISIDGNAVFFCCKNNKRKNATFPRRQCGRTTTLFFVR